MQEISPRPPRLEKSTSVRRVPSRLASVVNIGGFADPAQDETLDSVVPMRQVSVKLLIIATVDAP